MQSVTTISPKQTSLFTEETLTSLREDSHVKILAMQKAGQVITSISTMDLTENDQDCGLKCSGQLKKLPPPGWSQKTSRHSRSKESTSYYKHFPKSGTMRNGVFYQPLSLAHHITVKERGLWLTPTASDGNKRASFSAKSLSKRFDTHPNGNLAEQYAKITGKRLCPNLLEYMMGYPMDYTEIKE